MSIDDVGGNTINPAQTQPSAELDEPKQLDSLENRAGKVDSSPAQRLPKNKNWISRLFEGGRPSGEPRTVTAGQARAKLTEVMEGLKVFIGVADQAQKGTENALTKALKPFQQLAADIDKTIDGHEREGNKPFSQAETRELVRDFKQLHKIFGTKPPRTFFAKQKAKAAEIQLTDRQVRAEKNDTPRFTRLKEAFQSFKNLFKGLRLFPRNVKIATSENQKTSTVPVQRAGVARATIESKAADVLAKAQAKYEKLQTQLDKEECNPLEATQIKARVRTFPSTKWEAKDAFLSIQNKKGELLSNTEVQKFNQNVKMLGDIVQEDYSEHMIGVGDHDR